MLLRLAAMIAANRRDVGKERAQTLQGLCTKGAAMCCVCLCCVCVCVLWLCVCVCCVLCVVCVMYV